MVVTSARPASFSTYLTPGQRFQSPDRLASSVIVARLVTDALGLLHVILRLDDGREISAFAEQVEAAIAEGYLTPTPVSPNCTC